MRTHALFAVALLSLPLTSLSAQERPSRLELAASGGYFSVSGWETMGVRTTGGWGFQAALRYRIWGNTVLEIGGHWSDHDFAYPDSLRAFADTTPGAVRNISLRALYVQPTVRLGSPAATVLPYLGVRIGVARWDAHRPADWDTGLIYGGVLGIQLCVSQWVALEASGSFTHLHFAGGHRTSYTATPVPTTTIVALPKVGANSIGAQAGVALHLPWLGR